MIRLSYAKKTKAYPWIEYNDFLTYLLTYVGGFHKVKESPIKFNAMLMSIYLPVLILLGNGVIKGDDFFVNKDFTAVKVEDLKSFGRGTTTDGHIELALFKDLAQIDLHPL